MTSYAILLLVSIALNLCAMDKRGVCICALVGFGVFIPIPDSNFYFWCMAVEAVVAIGSIFLKTRASQPVCALSLSLLAFHYLGYKFDGYPPESPYHFLVKIAEHAEIVACALFSKPIMGRLKHASI